MTKFLFTKIIFLFCLILTVQTHAENVVIKWNQEILNAIEATRTPPTVASRNLAIVHTAMYNAWSAYDKKAISTRFGSFLKRPAVEFTTANKSKAISFAAFRTLLDLFPTQSASFTSLIISLGYNPGDTIMDTTTPEGIGNVEAEDLLLLRHEDGSNQLANEPNTIDGPYSDYTGYVCLNTSTNLVDPSRWQPFTPSGIFLNPHWGLVLPFALKSGNEFRAKGPALYPSREYSKQAKEVLELSAGLNNKRKSIALYWSDGPGTVTPPGHWNLIAQFVSSRDHNSLNSDVKLFFALNNGLMDACIAAWDSKRAFDSVRPISALRFLYNGVLIKAWGGPGQGTQTILGQNWLPYLPSPSFPDLVSGHSAFSASAAEILKLFTRSDFFGDSATVLAGSSFVEPGYAPTRDVKLFWETFSDAANEAGISRRFGGIHFKDGDHQGRKLGKKVGKAAFRLA
ncbi:MAG: vanadium-dependent haloperoxidase, partial [Parachlamydiaceae bacterium]|nr:vanadium-dependent haloperoxidase [Parachlamydiaceae bacterium]